MFRGEGNIPVDDGEGFFPGESHHVPVFEDVADANLRKAVLASAEELSDASEFQVFSGYLETVACSLENPQPFLCDIGFGVSNDKAISLLTSSPDPPSHLVKLREPEALPVCDENGAGVGDVNPDLNDRRSH